ncbi:hypothetical protein QJS10_CPA08g01117 [Acorus calamus]|uniref:EDRF1 N-terminal domain-containing protein n=1 Tax=Acorus calamus TaxID=4465 RepID=A0AAV9EDH9_ACOCL|nr:hypothetical protein QJS10_CPA08g01117 [Acorus calamus]
MESTTPSTTTSSSSSPSSSGGGELSCVGTLEIAKPKPSVGFICGSLPVLPDGSFSAFRRSNLLVPSSNSIRAPRYQMLPTETDLNSLPLLPDVSPEKIFPVAAMPAAKAGGDLHWESGGSIDQNLARKCEALAVSGLTDYGDEIDVIAPTDLLKQIFKIPYSKARLSIAVHRIGDTLILNSGPDVEEGEKLCRKHTAQNKGTDPSVLLNFAMHSVRAEACDCPPSHKPSEDQSNSPILPGKLGSNEGSFVSPVSHGVKPQYIDPRVDCSLKESFNNHPDYSQESQDKFFWGTEQNKQSKRRGPVKKTSQVGEKPTGPVQEPEKFRRVGSNEFLRVLLWQFHNFRMLLGSDLLLFSNEKYASVSLHLWDVSRQVTPMTWLEAWLDNVMASVPELAICYHRNGVVQGYELLKTDDIFLLKGISDDGTPAFHPQVVQQNGLSVLRFLQNNCKQDPGAYWLYKNPGEDMIQLFDLSVIPKSHSTDSTDQNSSSFQSLIHKGRRDSLFSLGTLLYRVAHRLSLSKAPNSIARCGKFFQKCLEFLNEQDHLVVRAYAHEQFARLILKCYEELELTSESALLESEVSVMDVNDESSEFNVETSVPAGRDNMLSQVAEDRPLVKDGTNIQNSLPDVPETVALEENMHSGRHTSASEAMRMENLMMVSPISDIKDGLAMCQVSAANPSVVQTIADPISSKLAAIHHVSQAIKSLRWKRQLQSAESELIDRGNKIQDRSLPANFSVCTCGDADCIEVCDIRGWLPKSKMDQKLWKLVLLLGESYLALGEGYKDDGQLHRALKVVNLASSLYGSMPQYFEDAHFISSMVGTSLSPLKFKSGTEKKNLVIDYAKGMEFKSEKNDVHEQLPSNCLFWAKAWVLVGDVYAEFHRVRGKEILDQEERKETVSDLRMSNEVVREVERLKKKLGQYNKNCSMCSLINCSCRSDRASSGSSASSTTGSAPSVTYGRRQTRKLNAKNTMSLRFGHPVDSSATYKQDNASCSLKASSENKRSGDEDACVPQLSTDKLTEASEVRGENHSTQNKESKAVVDSEYTSKDTAMAKDGGIFKFLGGPKVGDAEYNLSSAISCYDAARKAMYGFPMHSAELQSIVKKKGWVFNELGRFRLNMGDIVSAEFAFMDAVKAFKEVYDHTNIILINFNLGHGRRALAEEVVAKIEKLEKHGLFHNAYRQAMKEGKMEYMESLKFYGAARSELSAVEEGADPGLFNEVCTQFANTYLRLGMLLAREDTSAEACESRGLDDVSSSNIYIGGETKEWGKHSMTATCAFREALSLYESLGELRRQEAAYTHFQLACYHRDRCLKFVNLDHKHAKLHRGENHNRQRSKHYASLAERNFQSSIDFYGPRTHPTMHLTILMEQSALSLILHSCSHSNMMIESALSHLLEGHRVVGERMSGPSCDQNPEVETRFWNQLQALLKKMLAIALSTNTNRNSNASHGTHSSGGRAGDVSKLRELYRMSLKSSGLSQLPAMYNLWIS